MVRDSVCVCVRARMCVPELALEGVDFTVHGISGLGGILQLPLELPAVGVGSLCLLLSLL